VIFKKNLPNWSRLREKNFSSIFSNRWRRFWMRFAGLGLFGRIATNLASAFAPPFYGRQHLGKLSPTGYISTSATIHNVALRLNTGIFIDERVFIFQDKGGEGVELGKNVLIYRDTIIQTGYGGSVTIGTHSSIQPRCQLSAYKAPIRIGCDVMIASNCAFYSYDHSIELGEIIRKQPLKSKGGIVVEDDAWLGVGVIVLDGVRIGKGAVVGAGSVVNKDIPDYAIAVGNPARVVKIRGK
jgi:acetyltransferase-like isoleucine patch superfamily enzyme